MTRDMTSKVNHINYVTEISIEDMHGSAGFIH